MPIANYVEIILSTGSLSNALKELREGLKSHGSNLTPEASEFFYGWLKRHMVASVDSKISELSRRLSKYECVYHEVTVDGCDDCAKHQTDEEWENPIRDC